MSNKKLNINKFSDEAEQDDDTSSKRGSSDSVRPHKTFADHWKWLKWIFILLIIGLIVFLIVWFSMDHNRKVTVNNIVTTSEKKVQFTVDDGKSTKDLTANPNDVTANYFVVGGEDTIYKFYASGTSWGTIEFTGSKKEFNSKIDIKDGATEVDATLYKYQFDKFVVTYASVDDKHYIQTTPVDSKAVYVLLDSEQDETFKLFLKVTSQAGIVSSINVVSVLIQILPTLLIIAVFIWYFSKMSKLQGGGGEESLWSVGKSQAKLARSTIKFVDVAGLKEEKEELIEIVDYLKNPNKYAAMGARAPKGVILYGPPGTGKTLLAKAVAGEAKVPFYQVSGSSFEDMLVGVGAKRVRDLFNNAKKSAPSIIFIDEFDSVAAKRGKFDIAGNSAGIADQTIKQLLAEMAGFDTKSGVVIIAATNRLDVLDDAILRPGRFDRHVQINLPDIKEREAILEIHAKNKNISRKVVLGDIARRTPGFSGAQLENVLNEATLLAVRNRKTSVGMGEIDEAIDRVIAGPAKHTRVITKEEKRQIAFHEAGHALVGLNIPGSDVVEKITIIPRGQAAGYTLATPEKQEISIQKKSDLLAIIASTLGGRAAEEVIYGNEAISTGAANDLYKVTGIVRAMVTQLGMTNLGMTQFIPSEGQQNPYSHNYSEATAERIDQQIESIIQEQYKRAKDIIANNKKELELIVTSLLVLETIVKNQIDYIHKYKKLPNEVIEKQKELDEEIAAEKKYREEEKQSKPRTRKSKDKKEGN